MNRIIVLFIFIYLFCDVARGSHFHGGTIRWTPIDPYTNSSSVDITIIQSYAWTYPMIACASNVPISTSGRGNENRNLTCVTDCDTDGGYSTKPINILTDCKSANTSLKRMVSERSKNVTLAANAHFYLAYVGTAWRGLNDPIQSGLEWSIVTFIDLRKRSDGFINTPPVAQVVSPQYTYVNKTIQIQIPVSDANTGDTVRCRWSTYTSGLRRKRQSNPESSMHNDHDVQALHRTKRATNTCGNQCNYGDLCSHSQCSGTICVGTTCPNVCCSSSTGAVATTTSTSTTSTTSTTTSTSTSTTSITSTATTITTEISTTQTSSTSTTTLDTPGTLKSTSTYPRRQAIDECGGICFPGSLPNGTSLSGCTITFTGPKVNRWYGVAVQVEDFIDSTSTTPMSSVPVQFLIYVGPLPNCSIQPVFVPVNGCLEYQVGVAISLNLSVENRCDPIISVITDIIIVTGPHSMSSSELKNATVTGTLSYITLVWTPDVSEIGPQQLCSMAYTSETVQSQLYCVTLIVKNTSDLCVTTTTSTTSTTSTWTTSTSSSTSTTSTTSTSTTSSTSTSTTTSTSTSTTSSTSTSTTTSTSTSTTSSTSTSTTTTTTTTSTSTTSATTSTTTGNRMTSTKSSQKPMNYLLILGLSLLSLLLAICCCCCCLYWLLWAPAARRRRRQVKEKDSLGDIQVFCRKTTDSKNTLEINGRFSDDMLINENYPTNDTFTTRDSFETETPSSMEIYLSPSPPPESEEISDNLKNTVLVRKVSRAELIKLDETTVANQNHADLDESIDRIDDLSTRLSSDGLLNFDINRMPSKDSNSRTTQLLSTSQVHIRRLSRATRLSLAIFPQANMNAESGVQLDRATVDTSLKAFRSDASTNRNPKVRKSNSVVVTRIRHLPSRGRSIQ